VKGEKYCLENNSTFIISKYTNLKEESMKKLSFTNTKKEWQLEEQQ